MIIPCPACKTKYRLDEEQIPAEGAWLRCTRCQHLFFYQSERETWEEIFPESELAEKTPPRKKRLPWVWILSPILVIIVIIGLFFAFYLPGGSVFLPFTQSSVPEEARPELKAATQIKITDLRQSFVENTLLGKIRVVQGAAVNTSAKFMTRIKVKAELYDVLGVRIMESYAYCGNILTDQELSTATEEDIVKRLSLPLGTEVSTEKVPPQGTVPFMIVFMREPPGAEKTLVMPWEAEFLLQ
ncbi:MAG TPA: zinc-ribbon domain-containing protein [Syntrophales bacterium]|mgnify:CR=1 FL=1|nr:zinc-ribbon domain-containing protein [Syntrophales bacterium]HOL59518.1 zinc-ribbon domain-containing protein [Syntrophales bacterium]HPO35608.1 zinc-ribbon domain-containing protein [Syntrophales bacterium]